MATENLLLYDLVNNDLPYQFNTQTIHNLDTAVTMVLIDINGTVAPTSPSIGDSYHVLQGEVGDPWLGYRDVVATWNGGSWTVTKLRKGMHAYIQSLNQRMYFSLNSATHWVPMENTVEFVINIPNPSAVNSDPALYNFAHYPLWFRDPGLAWPDLRTIDATLHGTAGAACGFNIYQCQGGPVGGYPHGRLSIEGAWVSHVVAPGQQAGQQPLRVGETRPLGITPGTGASPRPGWISADVWFVDPGVTNLALHFAVGEAF